MTWTIRLARPTPEPVGTPAETADNTADNTTDDVKKFIAHSIRYTKENGRGGVYFSPIPSTHRRHTDELERRLRTSWGRGLAELGWRRTFIAVAGDEIIGHLDLDRGAIEALAHRLELGMVIEYDYKGKGIGTALMKEAIAFACSVSGVEWIDLGVFHGNERALALYEKFGFKETGRVSDRFRVDGQTFTDIQMALALAKPGAPRS